MFEDSIAGTEAVDAVEHELLLEAQGMPVVDRKTAALEMALSLVINRESSEDAIAITQIADVFLSWLEAE